MHNPTETLTYRDDRSNGNGSVQRPSECFVSGYDERDALKMPLTPKHTAEDEMEDLYGSTIDWDSVMYRDDDY
jgi:hypothetical protein